MAPILSSVIDYIDTSKQSLWIATASILFNPVYWNIMAQSEYRNKTLTRLTGGRPYLGCYILAVSIFSLGILRDHLYNFALDEQPKYPPLMTEQVKLLAGASFVVGSTLVVTSMWALGVTGTYLGDYFGILMEDRVTSFPFNVTNNPMYDGSTLCFLSTALWKASPTGIALSALVYVWYKLACLFEEPFTGEIYAKREQERKQNAKKSK